MPIPYEAQERVPGSQRCGAAALCMVYRSLERPADQAEVWSRIALPGWSGQQRTRTFRLCRDGLEQGLEALIVQARHPRLVLTRCQAQAVRVIVSHRAGADRSAGHYSVLADVLESAVLLHDPASGPDRRLSWPELEALWSPGPPGSEVIGWICVAIALPTPQDPSCPDCGRPLPLTVPCSTCGRALRLRPAAALGCLSPSCPGRTWEQLFCPTCDRGLDQVLGAATSNTLPLTGE